MANFDYSIFHGNKSKTITTKDVKEIVQILKK